MAASLLRVLPPDAAALGLAEAPAAVVRDPIARRIRFDPPDPAHREPGVPCSSYFLSRIHFDQLLPLRIRLMNLNILQGFE